MRRRGEGSTARIERKSQTIAVGTSMPRRNESGPDPRLSAIYATRWPLARGRYANGSRLGGPRAPHSGHGALRTAVPITEEPDQSGKHVPHGCVGVFGFANEPRGEGQVNGHLGYNG